SRVRTWLDEREKIEPLGRCPVELANLGGAMTATAFVHYVAGPWPVPAAENVPDAVLQTLANDSGLLAIITNRSNPVEMWRARLARVGMTFHEVGRHYVPLLSSGVTIYAGEIVPTAPAGMAFGKPVISVTTQMAQDNVYGTRKGRVDVEREVRRFLPGDAQDHVSYPFVDVAPRSEDAWAQLTVEFPPSAANPS